VGTLRSTTDHSRTLVVGGVILGDGTPDGKEYVWQDGAFPDGTVDAKGTVTPDDPEAVAETHAVTADDLAFTPLPARPTRHTAQPVTRPDPVAELAAKVDALEALVIERTDITKADLTAARESS
jgi:hypothetical protein